MPGPGQQPATSSATRERIVDAAAEVIQRLGLAKATTREIARAAGYSEATIYKHFRDKGELVLEVVSDRLPQFVASLKRLMEHPGEGTVEGNLTALAAEAVVFYGRLVPITSGLFAETALLADHQETMARTGGGPHRGIEGLAAYLRAEQALGRVDQGADVEAGAALLLGACFQRAFVVALAGRVPPGLEPDDDRFAAGVAATVLRGLAPR
jgi:AcrR family transcriptional regulator